MLHFAYGEDLPRARFLERCPGAEWFGPARLEGHRLVFDAAGRIGLRAQAEAAVWGALWLVPAEMLPVLDARAGAGLERTTRRIVSPAGPRTEATLYLPEIAPGEEVPPPAAGLRALRAAAKENNLPAAYLAEPGAWATGGKSGKDSR